MMSGNNSSFVNASVAQLVEQGFCKAQVASSNLVRGLTI